jgi:hypothetical protein
MASMAIDRRRFLAGFGAALLAAPGRASATATPLPGEAYYSGRGDGRGHFSVAAFDGDGEMLLDQALPARCHAIAVSPDGRRCVAVARRPGTFAVVVDLPSRTIVQQFAATPGRTFAGHAVFSEDGSRLLLTEDDTAREEGFVAIRAVADAYRPAGDFRTHGVGPHELLWSADGRTIAVANGGILINPDSGRVPLNIDSMQPSLALLDAADGSLQHAVALPGALHQLSIRHLALLSGGRLAFGMQYQGPIEDTVPLVGILAPDGAVRLLDVPAPLSSRVRQYIGSVATDASGRWLAASAPKGNLVMVWDADSGGFAGSVDIADGCGVCRTSIAGELLLTGGSGIVERVACDRLAITRPIPSAAPAGSQWDNHVYFRGA